MIDAVERNAAGAGQLHLERASELIQALAHQLDLAAASSDLCAIPPNAVGLIGKLAWTIAATHQNAKTAVARGIYPHVVDVIGRDNVYYIIRGVS